MSKNAKKTQPAPQKKNSSLIAMIVVLVVAVVLIVVLFARSNSLNSQLDTLNNELTETSNTLQQTITDKEAVEAQLTAAEESLREAQLTLEESTKKVADLEGQLTTLTEENNATMMMPVKIFFVIRSLRYGIRCRGQFQSVPRIRPVWNGGYGCEHPRFGFPRQTRNPRFPAESGLSSTRSPGS